MRKLLLSLFAGLLVAAPAWAQTFPMYNATVSGYLTLSKATISSGGTSCTNATALTAQVNYISSTTANQYYRLPAVLAGAAQSTAVTVIDTGGVADLICPNTTSGNINGNGAGVAVGVANYATFNPQGSDVWVTAP